MLGLLTASVCGVSPPATLRVTAKDCGAGFYALMLYAINQLIYAESRGFVPHVLFGETCRDGRLNRYYSSTIGPNVWEYYFFPVSTAVPSLNDEQLSAKQLFALHHTSTESVQTYPHGVYRYLKIPRWRYDEGWHRMMRSRAHGILGRSVRLRPGPLKIVRKFYMERIVARGDRPLLGLHIRGTDKLRNIGGRIIRPAEYHPLIRQFLEQRPNALLLLATDSPSFLAEMQQRYGEKLIVYDALRSERNAFADRKLTDNYRKGEDALVDSLLLSCANLLIKPASALSEFSVYWNPALHNHTIELQYEVGFDVQAAIANYFQSSRDQVRGLERCAPVLAPETT